MQIFRQHQNKFGELKHNLLLSKVILSESVKKAKRYKIASYKVAEIWAKKTLLH
jgi:hypothetical protein